MTPNHTIIIAEAGVNHNGNEEMARRMIQVARDAGADYVKFQTAVPELVISAIAPKAAYQEETTGTGQSQLDMCKAIHLPLSAYSGLAALCDSEGIKFLSTPFDLVSIDCLATLGMDYWKIPSGEITNLPYLRKIAAKGGKIIMSTGMSTLQEVEDAVNILEAGGIIRKDIALLHCNTQYPTPMSDVNLRAMESLRKLRTGMVGYSDHTVGIEVPVAAVAMGAQIIEKHFTLDKSLPGPDHRASLDPAELAEMVKAIRNIEQAIGSTQKHVSGSERPKHRSGAKSIVAARPIARGETLTEDNITVKRPGNGISPMKWDSVIGTKAVRDFDCDSLIELE